MTNPELTTSAAWLTLGHLVAALGGFLSLIVLARVLAPEDFGLFGLALIIIIVPESLIGGQLQEVLIQSRNITKRHISTMLGISAVLGLIATIVLFFAAPLFAGLFDVPELKDLLPVMAIILVVAGVTSTAAALMIRDMDFKRITVIDIASALIAALVGVAYALLYQSVWALVWMELSRRLVRLVMFIWM